MNSEFMHLQISIGRDVPLASGSWGLAPNRDGGVGRGWDGPDLGRGAVTW